MEKEIPSEYPAVNPISSASNWEQQKWRVVRDSDVFGFPYDPYDLGIIVAAVRDGTPHFYSVAISHPSPGRIFVHVPPKKAWDCPEIGDDGKSKLGSDYLNIVFSPSAF